MNRKFLAPILLAVLFVLLAIAPLAFGQKRGPQACPDCDWDGNCGACSKKAYFACVNDPVDRAACWQNYYDANCAAKWGCNGDINPF